MKTGTPTLPPLQAPKLLDQLRERIRYMNYSRRTEQAYVHWTRHFIRFHKLRHPREMGKPEVEGFLTYLVPERDLSVSSHKQALSALLFLYTKVLGIELPWLNDIGRPKQNRRLPVVMSKDEVARVLTLLPEEHKLFGQLLMAPACASTKPCNCGSRMSISRTSRSSSASAREGRIAL